jgi:hypothetical protein
MEEILGNGQPWVWLLVGALITVLAILVAHFMAFIVLRRLAPTLLPEAFRAFPQGQIGECPVHEAW